MTSSATARRRPDAPAGPVSWLRRLCSPSPARRGSARWLTALLLRLAGAGLLAWIGYIHLHLWQEGYRQIPVDGPFFLLDAVAGFALGAAVLAWPRPLAGLTAAGFTASTIGALVISLGVGLFGFRESIHAAYVVESLVIEAMAAAVLLAWAALILPERAQGRGPAPAGPGG